MKTNILQRTFVLGVAGLAVVMIGSGCGQSADETPQPSAGAQPAAPANVPAAAQAGRQQAQTAAKAEANLRSQLATQQGAK